MEEVDEPWETFTVHIEIHVNRADKWHWILHDPVPIEFLQSPCIIKYCVTGTFRQAIWSRRAYSSLKAWKSLSLWLPRGEKQGSPVGLILLVSLYGAWYYSEVSCHPVYQFYEIQYKRGTPLLQRMRTYSWRECHFYEFNNTGPIGYDIITEARFIAFWLHGFYCM